jgi:hypothetical protein
MTGKGRGNAPKVIYPRCFMKKQRPGRTRTLQVDYLKKGLVIAGVDYSDEVGVEVVHPKKKEMCSTERPCPYVSCRHHLGIEPVYVGCINLTFPDMQPWEIPETCSIDVAMQGDKTLEEVGQLINITRERVRQLETSAIIKARRAAESMGLVFDDLGIDLLEDARDRRESQSGSAHAQERVGIGSPQRIKAPIAALPSLWPQKSSATAAKRDDSPRHRPRRRRQLDVPPGWSAHTHTRSIDGVRVVESTNKPAIIVEKEKYSMEKDIEIVHVPVHGDVPLTIDTPAPSTIQGLTFKGVAGEMSIAERFERIIDLEELIPRAQVELERHREALAKDPTVQRVFALVPWNQVVATRMSSPFAPTDEEQQSSKQLIIDWFDRNPNRTVKVKELADELGIKPSTVGGYFSAIKHIEPLGGGVWHAIPVENRE